MFDWPILSTMTFLPLLGVVFILLIRGDEAVIAGNARAVALWTSLAVFILSLFMLVKFDGDTADFQFVERISWLGGGIDYAMGVDGISVLFVILATSFIPLCILASWKNITSRVREYMIAFLVMETLIIGTFCAMDLVLFYLFFETGLIPLFLIIGIWGGPRRIYAGFKFFLYTLLGSILLLLGIIYIYMQADTTYIPDLMQFAFSAQAQKWLWLAFFASFAVKLPMWPTHSWLPDAHVEAPTAGSVVLAAILLKMGGYGFLRFCLPMFPVGSEYFSDLVFVLSVIAIIYGALVALAQEDVKKLIAYSSVSHMGYVTLGIFSLTQQGVQGAIFHMLSHGWISGALFLSFGVIYDRTHVREIAAYGGLATRMPVYATLFMLFILANIGLPGTSGFVGELLAIIGVFQVNALIAVLAAFGVILSAVYGLSLYRHIQYGELRHEVLRDIADIDRRELAVLAPAVIATLLFGFYPMPILDLIDISVHNLIENYQNALLAFNHTQ